MSKSFTGYLRVNKRLFNQSKRLNECMRNLRSATIKTNTGSHCKLKRSFDAAIYIQQNCEHPLPPTPGFSRRHSRWGAPILVFPAKLTTLITHAPTCRVLNNQVKWAYNVKYISCINAMVQFTLMSASALSKVTAC